MSVGAGSTAVLDTGGWAEDDARVGDETLL